MDSLELRRLRFDLISVYKILFGMIETDVSALFVVNNDTVTRGHNHKLFVQQSRIDVRKYFFSNRVYSVGIVYQPLRLLTTYEH